MKTRFIKVTFVAAIAMIGAINVFNTNQTETLSDIALENVEALAESECEYILSGPMNYHITYLWVCSWKCTPGGVWQCPM